MISETDSTRIREFSRQGAKSPSLNKKKGNFSNDFHSQTPNFAAFASLREIFRDLVAALPRRDLRGLRG
jgi:hypothetical protein